MMGVPVVGMGPEALRQRGRRRRSVAVAILVAWVAGLGFLARRDLFVGETQRLAEAAMRLNPGATYFQVEQNGRQIGFASTTLDTTTTQTFIVTYYNPEGYTIAWSYSVPSGVTFQSQTTTGLTPRITFTIAPGTLVTFQNMTFTVTRP